MEYSKSRSSFILYVIGISAFFASLNQNIYSPIIPLVRDSFHVSVNMVNLSVSLFIFITAMMQIVFGPVIDSKGGKFVLIPCVILTVLSSIVCALATNFTVFLAFRAVQAVGTAAIPLIAATTIGNLFQGSERGNAMGTYQMMLSVAPAVAPVLGGFIGDQYSYPGIFWFLTVTTAVLLVINWLYFPNDKPAVGSSLNLKKLLTQYGLIFKSKLGNSILLLSFLVFFVYFSIIVYLPIVLTDHYGFNLQIVGLLYLPLALSTIAGSMLFKYIQAKIPLRTLFVSGNLLMVGSILFFALAHSSTLIGMFFSLMMHGAAVGILTPLYATLLSNEFEANRGSALGMFNFIRYIGMSLGPVITGIILVKVHSILVFLVLGVLFAAASILLHQWLKKAAIKQGLPEHR